MTISPYFKLTPEDNLRLANLCGPLDENLRYIESILDVRIHRRGDSFQLSGHPKSTAFAQGIIQNFYIEAKNPITPEMLQSSLMSFNQLEIQSQKIDIPTLLTRRSNLTGKTERQNNYLKQIQDFDITFATGPAGTGKTYLAVASAVDALGRDKVKRIVLVRPVVEAGEHLGFLPGDLAQKINPYLRPLYDALYDLAGHDAINKFFEKQIIEIAPLAYMRGRTLNQSFIILDEAQNTTPEQMKMFLTRIGFGTKVVITGDITQIDLRQDQKSGLIEAQSVLADVKGIAFASFSSQDVVRHPLVQRIVNAYEQYGKS